MGKDVLKSLALPNPKPRRHGTYSPFVDPYKEHSHGPCLLIQWEENHFDAFG